MLSSVSAFGENSHDSAPSATKESDSSSSEATSATSTSFYHDDDDQMSHLLPRATLSPSQFSAAHTGINLSLETAATTKTHIPSKKKIRRKNTIFSNLGFGVEQRQSNEDRGIATEAAIRAVRDAMGRFVIPPAFDMENASVRVKLGVPPSVRNDASKESPIEMKPMDIDLTRVAAAIPSIRLDTVDTVVGGLSCDFAPPLLPDDDDTKDSSTAESGSGTTTFCSVVAFVTIDRNEPMGFTVTDEQKESLEQLQNVLGEKEEKLRMIKEKAEWQAAIIRKHINETKQQQLKHEQERMHWECQAELLRKRLALRDESLMMLADQGETKKSELNEKSAEKIPQVPSVPSPQNNRLSKFSGRAIDECNDKNGLHHINHYKQMQSSERGMQTMGGFRNTVIENGSVNHSIALNNVGLAGKASREKEENTQSIAQSSYPFNIAQSSYSFHGKHDKAQQQNSLNNAVRKNGSKFEQAEKILCQHDYHDNSMEMPNRDEWDKQIRNCERRSGVLSGFPQKLYHILRVVQADGYDSIISWLPHGRAFRIHKQHEFENTVLPRYLAMTKRCSFLRQLNLYGFQRISAGLDKGSYYHENFLRGMMFLTSRIIRRQVNGKRVRVPSNPDAEPNFYAMRPLPLREKFPEFGASKPYQTPTKVHFLSKAKDEDWNKQALPLQKEEAPRKHKYPIPNAAAPVPMLPDNVSPTKLEMLSPNEGASMKQEPP